MNSMAFRSTSVCLPDSEVDVDEGIAVVCGSELTSTVTHKHICVVTVSRSKGVLIDLLDPCRYVDITCWILLNSMTFQNTSFCLPDFKVDVNEGIAVVCGSELTSAVTHKHTSVMTMSRSKGVLIDLRDL